MKPWLPPNWDKIKLEKVNIGNHPTQTKVAFLNFEGGADAEWKAVQDKIAKLSDQARDDDKEFRVQILLWLTKETNEGKEELKDGNRS